ncbi:PLP-dependent aminotransferase family protein [Paenibacillus sp. P96]|uniref:PLP-dependent aminotransferase family protein n=1 Tax=Paenibacillus zeirhizosphaerae TaxID=2987519 RepID=A0ABT9FKU3_9BACL|nr:PLP-dependent aminotransferase family protein [Paenibacillus sp. P96]MDP4095356.1 PLP-dependent aminotransferase family protein [Paenibacillus sp. P96]
MKKYSAILTDFEQKRAAGELRPGQKLPSVRQAADMYGCSISTVTRAYAELEKRHAIYSIPQSGYYIVEDEEQEAGLDDGVIDFASSSPDLNVFPYRDFQHCLNKAIDTYKYHLFTYGDPQGLSALRETLVKHLADDQVFAKAQQIAVTPGIQQALHTLAKMPFPNGRSVILVEQPSYTLYLKFLEAENLPVKSIARTAEGIDLQQLEELFRNGDIKCFYTMSRHHNPLGTSYGVREKKTIARLAAKYDVYVLEDDYMGDLGDRRGFEPIFAYDQSRHVVYLKSFSKIIFPGLRIGAVVLPEPLLDRFHTYNQQGGAALLSQAALDIYIKNGMYERHREKIYRQYEARVETLHDAVKMYNDAGLLEVADVRSGIYTQFKIPQAVNLERVVDQLKKRGVLVGSGKLFYLSTYLQREKFLRISISRARPEQIHEGVKAVIEEVKRGMNA